MNNIPFEPKYTRFPFLVLPYSKSNMAVPKELMVDYENKMLYVKSEDGTQDIPLSNPELKHHLLDFNNPHKVTKEQIGLGNVIDIAQASKEEFDKHIMDFNNPHKVTKEHVGLGNVINIMPASKEEFDDLKNKHDELALILEELKNRPGYATLYELKIDTEPPEAKVRVFYNNKWNDGKLHNVPEGEYSYEVFMSDDIQKFDLEIRPYPIDSDVYVYYNNTWNAGTTHLLPNGSYQVKVLKSGYVEKIISVNISDVSKTEIVRLDKIGYTITINTIPEDALVKVYYDGGYNEGNIHTNLPNGTYPVQVSKYGYIAKEEIINISNGNVTQSVVLESNTYSLILTTNPGDAKVEVFYNGVWNVGTTHSLPNGEYDIKVSKTGYLEYIDTIVINNLNKTENIILKKLDYNVTIVTVPQSATVEIYYDGDWKEGSSHRLPTGSYSIRVSYPGYETYNGTISITTEDRVIPVDLSESKYSLYVSILPTNAIFKLKIHGVWETSLNNLFIIPNGTYEYMITMPEYKVKTGFITIDGSSTTLDVELEKLIMLYIDTDPIDAEVKVKIGDSWYIGNEHWVESGSYDIEVLMPGYNTYTETIEVVENTIKNIILEPILYTLTINVYPEDSNIEVFYNDIWNVGNIHTISNGNYNIRVSKEGYVSQERSVAISNSDKIENITLDVIKYNLTIDTIPIDSVVEVEYDGVWNLGKVHTLPNGTYNVQVTRDGYITDSRTINILDSDKTESIILVEATYNLNINVIPEGSTVEVFYNDKWNAGNTHKLPAGVYNIKVSKEGYVSHEKSITISNGDKEENIELIKLYNLIINTTPEDAIVKVYYDNKWNTGKSHILPPGSYSVEVSKTDYITKSNNIIINDSDITQNITIVADNRVNVAVITSPTGASLEICKLEDYSGIEPSIIPVEERVWESVSNNFIAYKTDLVIVKASKSGYNPGYEFDRLLSNNNSINISLTSVYNDQYLGEVNSIITVENLMSLIDPSNMGYWSDKETGDIQWYKFKDYNNKELLVSKMPIAKIYYRSLENIGLVKYNIAGGYTGQGKTIQIGGIDYKCRLLTISNSNPVIWTKSSGFQNISGEVERLLGRFTDISKIALDDILCQESIKYQTEETEQRVSVFYSGKMNNINIDSMGWFIPVLEKI